MAAADDAPRSSEAPRKPRTWLWWHAWTGITSGLLLFVICWSGTVAVFSDEIDWLLNPALRIAPEPGAQPRWEATLAAARAAVPGHRITQVKLPTQRSRAAELIARDPEDHMLRVYANPYTAEVTGVTSYFNVQRFFRSFHMNLFFNAGSWGYYIVCAFAVPLLASAITALLFYKRWWQRWWVLKWDRGAAVFWSDLHKTGGLWSLWFVAIIALTGLWYLVEAAGVDMNYPKAPRFDMPPRVTSVAEPAPTPLTTDQLLQQARNAWPGLDIRNLYPPGSHWGNAFAVDGEGPEWLVRDRANKLFLDPSTGVELARQRAADLSPAARWVDTADPLHFGNFAGLGVKALWFAAGLLLCALVLTGAYLHVQRQQRKRADQSRRMAVTAAYAVSALVLAVSVAGGWSEVREYGPVVDGAQQWPAVSPQVVGFVTLWVLSTLAVLGVWVRKLK